VVAVRISSPSPSTHGVMTFSQLHSRMRTITPRRRSLYIPRFLFLIPKQGPTALDLGWAGSRIIPTMPEIFFFLERRTIRMLGRDLGCRVCSYRCLSLPGYTDPFAAMNTSPFSQLGLSPICLPVLNTHPSSQLHP
jgi:hypothetical protein